MGVVDETGGRGRPSRWRSIEAAGVAGLVHAVLALAATGLLTRPPAADERSAAQWYSDPDNQSSMLAGLNLVVVGSIAFIWFVAVIRRRVGERENRFFGSVFLGSALVLVACWLVAAVLLTVPALAASRYGIVPEASSVAAFQAAGTTMSSVVATRLEAVFVVSSTTVARLSRAFPTWIVVAGYAIGLGLLVVPLPNDWTTWVFPIWVALMSATLLVRGDALDVAAPVEAAA